ncbi:hypothetical protein HK097_006829, partial [Rhizophlyctis rosea]
AYPELQIDLTHPSTSLLFSTSLINSTAANSTVQFDSVIQQLKPYEALNCSLPLTPDYTSDKLFGLRYYYAFPCGASSLWENVQRCVPGGSGQISAGGTAAPDGYPVLCKESCNAFQSSLLALFNDTKKCSQDQRFVRVRADFANFVAGVCEELPSVDTNAKCIGWTTEEIASCGFGDNEQGYSLAKSHCQSNPNDPCCAYTPSDLAATVAGVVGGLVFGIIAVAFSVWQLIRQRRENAMKQRLQRFNDAVGGSGPAPPPSAPQNPDNRSSNQSFTPQNKNIHLQRAEASARSSGIWDSTNPNPP